METIARFGTFKFTSSWGSRFCAWPLPRAQVLLIIVVGRVINCGLFERDNSGPHFARSCALVLFTSRPCERASGPTRAHNANKRWKMDEREFVWCALGPVISEQMCECSCVSGGPAKSNQPTCCCSAPLSLQSGRAEVLQLLCSFCFAHLYSRLLLFLLSLLGSREGKRGRDWRRLRSGGESILHQFVCACANFSARGPV